MRTILVLTGFGVGAAALRSRTLASDRRRRATERAAHRRSGAVGGSLLIEPGGAGQDPHGWPVDSWRLWELELTAD